MSREYLFSDSEAKGQNVNFISFRFLVESKRFYRSELPEGVSEIRTEGEKDD